MAIRSMTGFGSAEVRHDGWHLRVECRSVNHRGLDTRVYVPREWNWIEPAALSAIKERINRGRIELRIEAEADATQGAAAVVDAQRFRDVADELKRVASAADLTPPTVADVLSFRDVMTRATNQDVIEDDAFVGAVRDALDSLVANRVQEGEKLHAAFHDLVDEVESGVDRVAEILPTVADEYRAYLKSRVEDALEKFRIDELSEERLMQEVVYFADKVEIAEELQRARSHVGKMRELLDLPDGSAQGKQLDFYLQELVREANTMGSKSGSAELTDAVVGIKSAIEKMREQAANVE
jgi:uncharacterized protein (TIGR00255 family)